ncbi:MAG TPA: PorV/PorQ family protein, partial [Gemmatimonadales bacterium]|nr:PorV/PorQ family protein [Gemmatimonadales bacterium]
MPRRLLAFVLLVTATGSAAAQSAANGALALELPAAPRALALGNTGVALAGDETAVFYNPAQLGGVRRAAAGLSTQAYIAASSLHAVAVALPLGRGTLGLGLQALDYGDEEEYRCGNPADCQYGEPTGNEISATDGALTVGYGLAMGRLRVGAAAKLAYQSVASQSAAAVAADLGLGLDLTRWLSIGASLRNVGSRLGFDDRDVPLPRIARVGLAVPVRLGPGLALTA